MDAKEPAIFHEPRDPLGWIEWLRRRWPAGVLLPEHLSEVRIQAQCAWVVRDQPREVRGQEIPQGVFITPAESIGEWPKAMAGQHETFMLNLPKEFALALIEDKP